MQTTTPQLARLASRELAFAVARLRSGLERIGRPGTRLRSRPLEALQALAAELAQLGYPAAERCHDIVRDLTNAELRRHRLLREETAAALREIETSLQNQEHTP